MAHNCDSIIIVFVIRLIFLQICIVLEMTGQYPFSFSFLIFSVLFFALEEEICSDYINFCFSFQLGLASKENGRLKGKRECEIQVFFFLILSLLVLGSWSCLPLQSFLQDCSKSHLSVSLRPRSGNNHTSLIALVASVYLELMLHLPQNFLINPFIISS